MDPNEILKKILRRYGTLTDNIRATQIVESKIRKGIATYADAEDMSIRIGKALTTALKENLPDALTDGRLYRAIAEVVVEQPMKAAGKDVAKIAADIQRELNEEAGIGMNAIVPEMNQDQIDGIITGICNADSYETGAGEFFSQVENCLEGYVDDFVRENADFQYKAGLSPTIERKTNGKCCSWCSQLAGTYPYEDVSDRGNDVFRRHKNCHCLILYNPGDGSKRRQNAHTKRWTEEDKADRIALAEAGTERPDVEAALAADLERTRWEKVNPNRMQRIQGGFAAFPEGDPAGINVLNVKPKPGYFDVAMHGDTDSVGFGTKTTNMKARDLARVIRRDESYSGGPVRLMSCKTGMRVGDDYCFAEELANALGQKVEAPNDTLFINPDGSLQVGVLGKGNFVTFDPNERRRIR